MPFYVAAISEIDNPLGLGDAGRIFSYHPKMPDAEMTGSIAAYQALVLEHVIFTIYQFNAIELVEDSRLLPVVIYLDRHAPRGELFKKRRAVREDEIMECLREGLRITGLEVDSVKAYVMPNGHSVFLLEDIDPTEINDVAAQFVRQTFTDIKSE